MRYFIHLGFDGSRYSGWQKQQNTSNTVQEIIENTLSQIFKREMTVYGCGRTDAGVHASQYVLQTYIKEEFEFDLIFRLNKNLPQGIAIFEIFQVEPDQHCRYDAISRTYDYFIHWKKNPGLIAFSALYEDYNFDFDRMQKVVDLIRVNKDFRPLCKHPNLYPNTNCDIKQCTLYINEEQGRLRFSITSDRFLRGMIRLCVFYMIQVGAGLMPIEAFEGILKQEIKLKQLQPALPNGLFLSKIEYPFLELKDAHHIIRMLKQGLEY